MYHTKKENLALKDRLATWTRFIASAAAPLESETADTAYTPSPYPKLSMEVNLPRPAREHVQVPGEDSVECLEGQLSEVGAVSPLSTFQWSSDLSSTTSATFGHVLTLQNETVHTTPTQSPIKVNVSDIETRPHSFVPIVPHPLDLAELALPTELPDDNEITPALPIENTILIRFSINPDSAHQALPLLAPLLELRLSVSEPYSAREDPEVTGVNSLRAITTTNHNDIVLPANPVDIRITQSRDSTLQNSSGDLATWEPIAEFLAKSRLDFAAGRLDVAASQRFPIPLRLFGQAATTTHVPESDSHNRPQQPAVGADEGIEAKLQNDGDVTQTRKQEEETTSNRVRNTLYEFVGLELHRSITMPYPEDERFSLVYTSIEAGQGGGRRAELSLEPVPTSLQEAEGSVSGTTDQQDDYVRACYKMAETAKYWIGHSAAAKL